MTRGNLSRRGFVQQSVGSLVAAGLPMWFAREVFSSEEARAASTRKLGPNDKIVMGAIGTGSQGTGDMKELRKRGAEFIAVCDVDARHRAGAVKALGGKVDEYSDFRELLDRKDIDAVTVVTPDHWHALIAIEAMKKGKDIYCEKPLTLTVAEGQAMLRASAAANHPVFQTGSQQRSDSRFRLACELVRNGRLGELKTIETRIGDNPKKGPFKTASVPQELDWNFWLGQTPEVEFVPERCHYEFRWWYEYSGGKVTDWGAHHNDIAQWALGMDESGPVEVESESTEPLKDPNCYNCPPHFTITYTYANGVKLKCMSDGENGVKFEGEKGWIFVDRGKINASDKALLDEPLPKDATKLYVSNDHMRNFLDCIRDRQKTICPVEVGFRSVTVCHIGNISMRLGGWHLKWDPVKETFFGDALANEMLSRPMRAPWKLDV
ncbi:MAG TPA: Gfo/Idh/MocA family oxidoreductase [Isosphaeraceae bacterium]|jgi:predicted dehydrogenase|nr:Gfo/Idh/MocA family oxidoreductase [Isosphaeraceae bacterium]